MQALAAQMLLSYAGEEELFLALSPEEEVDLPEAEAEMERGASESDIRVAGVRRAYLTP